MHHNQSATNALPWNRSLAPTVQEASKKIGIQAINLAREKKKKHTGKARNQQHWIFKP
jgi:hypothetical protein